MVQGWYERPDYKSYKSPYGPSYRVQPNLRGVGPRGALYYATKVGSFGVVAGVFALFFFSEVPKVRNDIMQKLPLVGDYFRRDIPPEDNPF